MSRDDLENLSALDELLADRATVGLDDEQASRLEQLLGGADRGDGSVGSVGDVGDDSWDRAAAAVNLALGESEGEHAALSDLLARRVQADAGKFFGAATSGSTGEPKRGAGGSGIVAWGVAAVCAAAAIVLVLTRPSPVAPELLEPSIAAGTDEASPGEQTAMAPEPAPREPTPDELRDALLARQGTLRLPWTATEDPAAQGATGDVVWNDDEQRGYMLIRGLAANDVEVLQYQLWIFDPDRDERYPVDGGVFDVPAGTDQVVIPIDAKLAVADPSLFAITVEPPGGVVVSSRERIVLLAKSPS